MRILVTIGTTPFDGLLKAANEQLHESDEVVFQAWKTSLKSLRGIVVEYIEDIDSEFKKSDIVICHAGAGTVYRLLELGKKTVVVPNLERRDLHQKELAKFVQMNSFGAVVWDLKDLGTAVEKAKETIFAPYSKYEFFMADEISNRIRKSFFGAAE